MLRQGSVAGFAVYMRMLAVLLHVQNVRVAGLAGLVTRELYRVSGNITNGRAAIVTILPKGLGDNKPSYHQKQQKGEYE